MALHKDLTGSDIHVLPAETYADITARDADTDFNTDSENIDKVVRIDSPVSFYILTSITPTWSEFSNTGNDTLAEILANGNTSGGTDLIVSSGDDLLVTDHMSVGAATAPTTDSSIDLKASDAAFLPNRLTTTQRDALTPVEGMQIHNLTTNDQEFYNGTAWQSMGGGDVVGPASSTVNTVMVAADITGKLLKNSTVAIAPTTGQISGSSGMTDNGQITIKSTANEVVIDGALGIDADVTGLSSFNVNKVSGSDTSPIVIMDQTNTNPGKFHIHVGNRNPNGFVTAVTNTLYASESGTSSALFYNTSAISGTVWNKLLTDAGFVLADDIILGIGTNSDLTLIHDGINSFITTTTGDIQIRSTVDTVIIDGQLGIGMNLGSSDSSTSLLIANSLSTTLFEVFGDGTINIPDNGTLSFGTGSDFTMVHDGTNTTLTNTTGNLIVDNANTTGQTIFTLGSIDSFTNFTVRDSALSNIFSVFGSGIVKLLDNRTLALGTGNDLLITHNGTNSFITNITGDLSIDNTNTTGSTIFTLGTDTAATHFIIRDNSLNTIVDFRGSGVAVFADNREVDLGDSLDLRILHNGTDSLLLSKTGNLILQNSNVTGSTINILGTDTALTDFQIRNSSGSTLFEIDGAGLGTLGGESILTIGNGGVSTSDVLADNFLVRGNGSANIDIASSDDIHGTRFNSEGYRIIFRPGSNEQGGIEFESSAGNTQGGLRFQDSNSVMLWESFFGQIVIHASGGELDLINSSNDINVELAAISNAFNVQRTNLSGSDADALATFNTITTNGGELDLFVGSRDPNGNVTANTNSLYARQNGVNSALFYNASATTGSAWDKILTDAGFVMPDNNAIVIGGGGDLSIVHDGTDTTLTSITGDLLFDNASVTGSTIFQLGTDTAATAFEFINNFGSSILTIDGNRLLRIPGNVFIHMGDSEEMVIGFDAQDANIITTTGDLILDNENPTGSVLADLRTNTNATSFGVRNLSNDHVFTVFGDGVVNVPDNGVFSVGIGQDLSISHDGTNSLITSTTGDLIIDNTNITGSTIFNLGTDTALTDWQVANSSGTTLFGILADGLVSVQTGPLKLPSLVQIQLGGSSLLIIEHAGTTGSISTTVGNIELKSASSLECLLGTGDITTSFLVQDDSFNNLLEVFGDGSAELNGRELTANPLVFGAFGRIENYILYSEELDNAVWTDPLSNVTVVPNTGFAPNGEQIVDQVEWNTVGLGLRQLNLGTINSAAYTLSFWGRAISGNDTINFDLHDGTTVPVTLDSTLRRYTVGIDSGTASDFLDMTVFTTVGNFQLFGFSLQLSEIDEPYARTTDTQITTAIPGAVVNGTLTVSDNITVNGNSVSTQGSTVFDIFSNDDWPTAITAPDGELRVPLVLAAVYFIHSDLILPKMLLPEGTDPLAFQFTTFKGAKGVTNLFIDGDLTGHFWGRDCQGMRLFDIAFTDIGNSFTGFSTQLYDLVGLGGATSLLYIERCAFFQFKQEGQLVDIGLVQVGVQDGFNDSGWTVRSTAGAAAAGLVNSIINSGAINISAFPDTKHPAFSFIGVIADFAVTHYGLNLGKEANSGFYFDQALSGGVYGLTAFSYGGPTTHGEFFRPDLVMSVTAQANTDIAITSFSDSAINAGVDTTVNFGSIVDFTRGQTILIADEAAYNGTHEIVRVASDQMSFDINVVFSTAGAGTLKMVEHTVAANKLTRDETVTISGTTSYNATAQVLRETDTTFHLPQAFVADDATGTATSISLDETSNSLQVAVAGAQKDSGVSAQATMESNSTETEIPAVDALVMITSTSDFAGDTEERVSIATTGVATYLGENPTTLKLDGNITMEPATATKNLEATFFRQDSERRAVTFTFLTNRINETSTPRENGDQITFNLTDGTLPGEIFDDIVYFVADKQADSFQIRYTAAASIVIFNDDGSGARTYAAGDVVGSTPTLSITASNPGTVVPQALVATEMDDILYTLVSNKDDAVNIIVSKAYYRVFE